MQRVADTVIGGRLAAQLLSGEPARDPVATWSLRSGEVAISPFGRLTRSVTAALGRDAADVVRFLGR